MRVGRDLDGVEYIFDRGFARSMRAIDWPHEMPDAVIWDFYKTCEWGSMTTADFVRYCTEGAKAGILFQSDDWYPHGVESWKIVAGLGHENIPVTDRPFGGPGGIGEQVTIKALRERGYQFEEIHFVSDKTTVPDLDMMVDDKAENFEAMNDHGVDTWLVTRPWNKHVNTSKRVFDTLHFAEIVRLRTLRDRAAAEAKPLIFV